MTEEEYRQADDSAEAERLAASLRDPVGWPRPAAGFAVRCLAAILIMRHGGLRGAEAANQEAELANQYGAKRRWVKVAASVAAMAGFVGLAAMAGRVVLNALEEPGGPRPVAAGDGAAAVSSIEAGEDILTQKGGNTVIARKMAGVVGAAVVSLAVSATELTSEPTLVFMRPETSSFWNTATNPAQRRRR